VPRPVAPEITPEPVKKPELPPNVKTVRNIISPESYKLYSEQVKEDDLTCKQPEAGMVFAMKKPLAEKESMDQSSLSSY